MQWCNAHVTIYIGGVGRGHCIRGAFTLKQMLRDGNVQSEDHSLGTPHRQDHHGDLRCAFVLLCHSSVYRLALYMHTYVRIHPN